MLPGPIGEPFYAFSGIGKTVQEKQNGKKWIKSCLIVGFAKDQPIHVVCGWRGGKVAVITVYIPRPPRFVDPWTRGGKEDEESL